jgi:hypothetical protein
MIFSFLLIIGKFNMIWSKGQDDDDDEKEKRKRKRKRDRDSEDDLVSILLNFFLCLQRRTKISLPVSSQQSFPAVFVSPCPTPKHQTRRENRARDKCSTLFCPFVSDEEKRFYNIGTRDLYYKTFYRHNLRIFVIS